VAVQLQKRYLPPPQVVQARQQRRRLVPAPTFARPATRTGGATVRHLTVSFFYRSARGVETLRRVYPVRVYCGRGDFEDAPPEEHVYFRCHDLDLGESRDFVLSRMAQIKEEWHERDPAETPPYTPRQP
jgi:hypothetical protein